MQKMPQMLKSKPLTTGVTSLGSFSIVVQVDDLHPYLPRQAGEESDDLDLGPEQMHKGVMSNYDF